MRSENSDPRNSERTILSRYEVHGSQCGTEVKLSDLVVPESEAFLVDRPTKTGQRSGTDPDLSLITVDASGARLPAPAQIPRPDFVIEDGQIDRAALATFLDHDKNRTISNQARGDRSQNPLTIAAIMPVIEWATGVHWSNGATSEEAYKRCTVNSKMISLLESNPHRDEFVASLVDRLKGIAKGSSQTLSGTDITLSDLVRSDPFNTCALLIDVLSPRKSETTADFVRALLAFRKICTEDR